MSSASKMEESLQYRVLGTIPNTIVTVLAIATLSVNIVWIFSIIIMGRCMLEGGYIFLLMALLVPIVFLSRPFHRGLGEKLPWYDILLAAVSFGIPLYFFFNAWDLRMQAWQVRMPMPAYIMALIFWAIILEGCRRVMGLVFTSFILAFSTLPLYASIMPGILKAYSFSLHATASFHVAGLESIGGLPMSMMGKLVIGFLFFAAALMATGAGKAFLGLATALLGNVRGGPAKVAILGSALLGSISSGPIINVITTGSFTIPAMKRTGYPPHYAAAIEACASTGGMILPPVMTTVAFVMAGFLGIPYVTVALAAVVPSILYYLSLFVQIDGVAVKHRLKGLPKSELPSKLSAMKEASIYFIAIIVLVYLLLYLRREGQAPYYSAAFLLIIAMTRKQTRLGLGNFLTFFRNAGKLSADVTLMMMGVGMIMGSLIITGLGNSLSGIVVELARGNIVLLVILGAMISFIMGMGVSVLAIYVILAIMLAPPLIQGGLYPLAVHLFILYCGTLSCITPPVATASYVAASLANAPKMKTGWTACRMGVVLFIIPFFFVFNPAFILHGTPLQIIHAIVTGIIAVILLSSGVEGYLLGVGVLTRLPRAITLISGAMIFTTLWYVEVIGAGLIVLYVASLVLTRKFLRQTAKERV